MKNIITFLILLFAVSGVFAESFSPTQLKINAPDHIIIDIIDHEEVLEIPIDVSGTDASVIFLLFTYDKAQYIGQAQNGYLGWHYVNQIDTCIYISQPYQFKKGKNTIVWNYVDHYYNFSRSDN